MASRTSFFKNRIQALLETIERCAPLWVLCGMTRDPAQVPDLEERIFGNSGGKSYAEIPLQ